MFFRQQFQELCPMVLSVGDAQILQKDELHVKVPHPPGALSEFRKQLEELLLVPVLWNQFRDQGLDAAAVGAKTGNVLQLRSSGHTSDVPSHAGKHQLCLLSLRGNMRAVFE